MRLEALINGIKRELKQVLSSPWDITMFIVMPVVWCVLM